ncbi:MAG: patatin-like phospholipase family protein [Mariprofundus sp.]
MILLLAGCASHGKTVNQPLTKPVVSQFYTHQTISTLKGDRSNKIALILSFSGGGTRAAALAYGVLEELRDTRVIINGKSRRLLDEVDVISSVSGGSFTAAYYGLHGDGTFEDFEKVFLKYNFQTPLITSLLNPLNWFKSSERTRRAVKLYETNVFRNATFADMEKRNGPVILINASDLSYGVRFSFVQEYFNLLCSDLSSYPVANAVIASSAVPILFNPIVVNNYHHCKKNTPKWLETSALRFAGNADMSQVISRLESYYIDDNRKYVHFVDGGITDNLGLRAIYEYIELSGGAKKLLDKTGNKGDLKHLAVIAVDASTAPERRMDVNKELPSMEEVVDAVSDVQLHQYNAATLRLIQRSIKRWAQEMSIGDTPVMPHFIQLGLQNIKQADLKKFINHIPTSFSLSSEQVDKLIAVGRSLLRNNPDYQKLLLRLKGTPIAQANRQK